MGTTVKMTEKELGVRLRSDSRRSPEVVLKAMQFGAIQGKAFLIKKSPVDRGILRNAWNVLVKSNHQIEILNDQPYAGVIEYGARPFRISPAGREALKQWCIRQMERGILKELPGAPKTDVIRTPSAKRRLKEAKPSIERAAESMSWAIAKTFEKKGIKGKKFVEKSLQTLVNLVDKQVAKYLDNFFSRPVGSK